MLLVALFVAMDVDEGLLEPGRNHQAATVTPMTSTRAIAAPVHRYPRGVDRTAAGPSGGAGRLARTSGCKAKTCTEWAMFLRCCSPRSANSTRTLSRT